MNISFENPDKVNGLLTITVEESDFQDSVEKTLKDYRKKANIPGFRPGQAPMGLIKRQFGASVRYDAVNKFVGEQLYKYIKDNNIQMLGEPLPSDKQETPADIEKPAPYTFVFDIAVAPEFNITLDGRNKIDYYTIKADEKLINEQVDMYAGRAGSYEKVEEYDGEKNDMLKGDLRELDAEGNTKEGGITVEAAVLMPSYIKVDEQKDLFKGAKWFSKEGSLALSAKPGQDLIDFIDKVEARFGSTDLQLVTISRPSAYGEYEPYEFVDSENELIDKLEKQAAA